MFSVKKLNKINDFFQNREGRPDQGVYFVRFIGYDNATEFSQFLDHYCQAARQYGTVITNTISNPSEEDIKEFYAVVGENFRFDLKEIMGDVRLWMGSLKPKFVEGVATAVFQALTLVKNKTPNDNVIKNAYIKLMCWMRNIIGIALKNLSVPSVPKILYIGDISKYELYLLYIAALSGCDVAYVHFISESSYRKTDINGTLSQLIEGRIKGPLAINSGHTVSKPIPVSSIAPPQKSTSAAPVPPVKPIPRPSASPAPSASKAIPAGAKAGMNEGKAAGIRAEAARTFDIVETNTWVEESFFHILLKNNSLRSPELKPKIYNFFVRYVGIDNPEEYNNRLYKIREDLKNHNKPYVLIENKILNPSYQQVAKYSSIREQQAELVKAALAETIQIDDKVRKALAQRGLLELMDKKDTEPVPKLYNYGVRLLCWLEEYAPSLWKIPGLETIPTVLYFGKITAAEADFLYLLSVIGADVVFISPNKEYDVLFRTTHSYMGTILEELPESMEIQSFPDKELRIKVATTAYKASEELNNMLYDSSTPGLYRARQFQRVKPITLKTTYDEIFLLWKEEAQYRPSFETNEKVVKVPNIFAKVCGVDRSDTGAYWSKIRSMITEDTIVATEFPMFPALQNISSKSYLKGFVSKGQLQHNIIKKHSNYHYDYLSDDTQDTILEKIEELIQLGWIEAEGENDINCIILETLLNLDRKTLNLIQKFDYTKEIPKLLMIHVSEKTLSLTDCIYIAFLNLVGFDVAIFTPTGYKDIEKYIHQDAYELFHQGELMFGLSASVIHSANPLGSGGIIGKLFGKGRN